jgi:hypothetical protein
VTDTPPPTTRPSAVHENPLVTALKRAEKAETELRRVRVQLASIRPTADRPPLSKRIGDVVHATPAKLQWAALISALAALLAALTPLIRDVVGIVASAPP